MRFEHRYAGSSGVRQDDAASAMSFSPDTLRPPTYFHGRVARTVPFREAISALHDVVTSDLRFTPKDRTDYLAWRAQQSYLDLAKITSDQQRMSQEISALQAELVHLEAAGHARRKAFYDARARYWKYLYERDKELWFKLDPVITVHPDQVFFECFSKDESSYGRLAANYEVFEELGERAHGTTNIDYSDALYGEFQKLRSYKTTTLAVDPGGFDVTTSMEDSYREVKIDVPESWVRGFLQVSAAATLPAHVVDLHPMDVHNLCLILRRNKELFGPRSLRFQLTPGMPVKIVVEPWNTVLACPRSTFVDGTPAEIRIWGRRRLFILERLLPWAKRVRVFLLGPGLPSYWVVDLGGMSFTLGLSGWTLNNWSDAGNFDLMAAREEVDSVTSAHVFAELGKSWLATPGELAQRTGLATPIVASALAGWVQAGRAIYDLERGVYRKRELTRDPLPVEKLRFANAREERAAQLLHTAKIAIDRADAADGGLVLAGRIKRDGKLFAPELTFDVEQRLVAGECTCDFFVRNRLHKGPCEHMLALRAAHRRGVNDTIAFEAPRVDPRGRTTTAPDESRENFQAAFRKAVMRAAELRAAGRSAESVAELERISRLAPPASDEQGRLQEVIAESKLEIGEHDGARMAAERALARFPASALALRVKRDALVALGELAAAVPVARHLVTVDNTAERWDQLLTLCQRIEDWPAMLGFAEEALRVHPRAPALAAARDVARGHLPAGTTAPPPAEDSPAPAKPSWWRRAVNAITGRSTPATMATADSFDHKLTAVVNELALRATIADRVVLTQLLRVAYASADHTDGRVFAMVAAIKDTPAIRDLPSDQELIALLRRELA